MALDTKHQTVALLMIGIMLPDFLVGQECYTRLDRGESYRGKIGVTQGGVECLNWNSEDIPKDFNASSPIFRYSGLEENYCRNPDGQSKPWCFIGNRSQVLDFCAIPECQAQECYISTQSGKYYRGLISETISGKQCQDWNSQYPQRHNFTPASYPSDGLDSNYCRNPGVSYLHPWCYVADSNFSKTWDYCEVPPCGIQGCFISADNGSSYRGSVSTTETGKECLNWTSPIQKDYNFTEGLGKLHGLNENYCRNPFANRTRPWCFTLSDENATSWEYCNVTECPLDKCYLAYDHGASYSGNLSITELGLNCQRWDSNYPNAHTRNPASGKGFETNFCRNPDSATKPWCYTNSTKVRWDYCNVTKCQMSCTNNEFQCLDKTGCLKSQDICSGYAQCWDHSDEQRSPDGVGDERMCNGIGSGNSDECIISGRNVCGNKSISFCEDGVDECLCSDDERISYVDFNCFRCLSFPHIVIPKYSTCDGIFDCPDLTDECLCTSNARLDLCKKAKFEDFSESYQYNAATFSCIGAQSNSTIKYGFQNVCDNRIDCQNREDEIYCKFRYRFINQGKYQCANESRNATRCDGIPECDIDTWQEECNNCTDPPAFCKYFPENATGIDKYFRCLGETNRLIGSLICNGIPNCISNEDEEGCKDWFYCNNGSVFHIPMRKRCNQIEDCEDGSDERGCNASQQYYCKGGDRRYLSPNQVCDGVSQCQNGDDECLPKCIKSIFSSVESMIKNMGIASAVWIICISALLGNFTVLIFTVRDLWLSRNDENRRRRINKILILSLSLSDFLVGVYAFGICLKSVTFEGNYCVEDQEWRSSWACSIFGILLVIGSEQSVFNMVMITISRIDAARRPMAYPSMKLIKFGLPLSWTMSILLAILPLYPYLDYFFLLGIWYGGQSTFAAISRPDLDYMIHWLMLMHKDTKTTFAKNNGAWSTVDRLVRYHMQQIPDSRKFRYYSSNSMCLATMFSDPTQRQKFMYSMTFIIINFLSFLFMMIGYVYIYRKYTEKNIARPPEVQQRTSSMLQTKLTRIVVTDFCCWMPVCIMSFLQYFDVYLPRDLYLPVGLVLIPVNSALNPFLYSTMPDIIWKKMRSAHLSIINKFREISKSDTSQEETLQCDESRL